jgi:hypothetical protein
MEIENFIKEFPSMYGTPKWIILNIKHQVVEHRALGKTKTYSDNAKHGEIIDGLEDRWFHIFIYRGCRRKLQNHDRIIKTRDLKRLKII